MKTSYLKKLRLLLLCLTIAFVCQSCLVSRCKRPQIIGYIYDLENRKPIENCLVGESLTDKNGYFQLKELRYSQLTFLGYEAPPLQVNESVYKEGYDKKTIELFNPFGGGNRKGTVHNVDTIFLKKTLILPAFK
ncbi:hypothetical protein BC749_107154 [Flavobacterium araucananum]|uniref:Carboxypeptidase-like regulatory domain-containing protein n=1 Tax=Flavobacterium araucananum TaxID=946678 RepID=A0A227PAK8_9FLAO|nr:hypothetical protein [Flavobacterium araucananum]OXG06940.1 hypothetical protein B0A64_08940 [Flavobacterium araucananum]PWJ97356.1 hypothetical protein BC749_107154 [Flavobacterium araucananum]